jgi:hypothetical protein
MTSEQDPLQQTKRMNSTIKTSNNRAYHTIANAEFTGLFDRMVYNANANTNGRRGYIFDYHLFIKFDDKVYMDVKNIGEIVISFAELQKNKFWNYYYNLSLMLANDKHSVIQDLKYSSENNDYQSYTEARFWSIDTAFIECNINTKRTKIINDEDEAVCYYKINPYDLETMEYTTQEDLNTFKYIYMTKTEFKKKVFDKTCIIYNNLVIDFHATLMEKELEDLSAIIQDKKNIITLSTLLDNEDMNGDILISIYNNLVSTDGYKKYLPIITNAPVCNRLELLVQILSA